MRQRAFKIVLALLFCAVSVQALSRRIDRAIEFPKGFPEERAAAVHKVIGNEKYRFVDGYVSYWPPDWGTHLSFESDAETLNTFIEELVAVKGMSVRLKLYRGRKDETRHDTAWQLRYSHARPNELAIWLNLNSELDVSKLSLPAFAVAQP